MANVNELCSNWLENYFAERPQIEQPKQGVFGYEMPVWASAVIQKLLNDQMVWIDNCERLDSELEAIKKIEQELRMQYISDFGQEQQCYEENAKLKEEIKSAKEQPPFGYVVIGKEAASFTKDRSQAGAQVLVFGFLDDKDAELHEVYKKPAYQHSFTVDGHTFYADSEVDILYLERKFGVGGKVKLNLVEDN